MGLIMPKPVAKFEPGAELKLAPQIIEVVQAPRLEAVPDLQPGDVEPGDAQAPEAAVGAAPRMPGREGPLSILEERRLARRWRTMNDEKALAKLIQAHLGL